MNKKTLGMLKIAYARVMSTPAAEFAAKRYRSGRAAKSAEKYNNHLSSLYSSFSHIKEEDTAFSRIRVSWPSDTFSPASFDIWGYAQTIDAPAVSKLTEALKSLDEHDGQEGVPFGIAICHSGEGGETPDNIVTDSSSLYFLSEKQSYIFEGEGFSLGAVGILVEPDSSNQGRIRISGKALASLAFARENCDCTLVYALNKCGPDYEKTVMKYLVNLGTDFVFATDTSSICAGVPFRRLDGCYESTCPSTGKINLGGDEPSVVFRHKLIRNPNGGEFLLNRSFFPVINGKVTCFADCKNNEALLESYKEIVTGCRGYRPFDDRLTIGDICRIIEVPLPQQYSYMENVSAGKITTHWPDSEKGDVMFFNQPYHDVNDVIDKPLKIRLLVVEKALEKGVSFVFTHVPLDSSIPHVVVPDPMEAHIKLCAHLREGFSLKTVGITGSIGKTSTKDMLYNVLKQKYDTDRNLRNTNTQVNIGLHIQNFRQWQEIYIQEIGGGRKGGASRHSRMILPEAACVTNIGDAHIGNHGSREALMLNKLGIAEGLKEGGTLYLNGDDPLLSKASVSVPVVYYALDNREADYYAEDIEIKNGAMTFTVCHGDKKVPVLLNVLGRHNALNAVCCFAIAKQFNLSDEEIRAGLAQFRTSGVRQNFVKVGEYSLFVDCFNASPDSIDSSLSVLDSIDSGKGKKIAVIGDVTGAASMAKDVHKRIGKLVIGHRPDILVCYGKNSRLVYKTAKEAGLTAFSFTRPGELTAFLEKNMAEGDVILFKGSSKMKLAQIIDSMFGTMFSEQMYADSAKSRKITEGGIDYNVCPAFATVKGCSSLSEKLVLPEKVKGKLLRNIDEKAFCNNSFLKEIALPGSVRHIGDSAFAGCVGLTDIYLPDNLMYIGDNSFAGCHALTVHCKENSKTEALCKSKGIL